MSVEIVDIWTRTDVELQTGKVYGVPTIEATEGKDLFSFSANIGASTPEDNQGDSIIKMHASGGIGWRVIDKAVDARLSWGYLLSEGKPSNPGLAFATYSIWYQAQSNEFGVITSASMTNLTVREIEEVQRPIFKLEPASSYAMTATLILECRVPAQEEDVLINAHLWNAKWQFEVV